MFDRSVALLAERISFCIDVDELVHPLLPETPETANGAFTGLCFMRPVGL